MTEVHRDIKRRFASGFPVSVFLPLSKTMLEKGNVTANETVREALAAASVHDYEKQGRGEDEKRVKVATLLMVEPGEHTVKETGIDVSMYRTPGKGERRIWFSSLNSFAQSGVVLGLGFTADREIIVANVSALGNSGSAEQLTEAMAPYIS